MKHLSKTVFTLLIFLSTLSLNASSQSTLPVPEFKNTVNQIDTAQKTLAGLEKTTALLDGKFKAFGLAGKEFFLNVKNISSTISFEPNQAIFIIKMPDSETDPNAFVELYKFEIKKDSRIIKVGKRSLMANAKQVDISKPEIVFTKVIPGCYLITTVHPLNSGSYGFMFSADVQSLGVSAKESTTVFAFDIK
jgi:hypothetical protein